MLICTNCGKRYPIEEHHQRCELCNEPLELEIIKGRKRMGKRVWERYGDFYPSLNLNYSLGEGDTPLLYSEKISKTTGNEVYLKNESANPTWSFKDRGTFVALNRAIQMGFDKIGVVSTGNMAASVAAYGAKAKLDAYVLVSSSIAQEKLAQIYPYGAKIVRVEGDYGELYYQSLRIGTKLGIYFMNSDDPFRIEGYKSIAYEISEDVEVDYLIVPTSSGGLFRGIFKGFLELKESGSIDRLPKMVAVQAEGCAPICHALHRGYERIERVENPRTIAHAIENPYPPSGNEVLRILKRYRWPCVSLSDEDILKSQRELASEGLFVQPASATTLGALRKLKIRDKRVALILTGSGLKVKMEYERRIPLCKIENLEDCMEGGV